MNDSRPGQHPIQHRREPPSVFKGREGAGKDYIVSGKVTLLRGRDPGALTRKPHLAWLANLYHPGRLGLQVGQAGNLGLLLCGHKRLHLGPAVSF